MDEKHKHPNSGFKWIILACCFINQMGTVGLLIAMSVLYVSWLEEFKEGKALTSWILSLGCALNLAFCPVPASLAEKFGFRAVGFIGALLTSAGLIASAFATSVSFVIVSLGFITGVGCSFAYIPSVAMVALYFEKRRAMAMGIAITGVGVGSLILAPLLNYLVEAYTWRGTHVIIGGITLNMCVTALLFRPIEMLGSDGIPVKNDKFQTARTNCNEVEETGDRPTTQINHEVPKIHVEVEEVVPCNNGNIAFEESQSLMDDHQINTTSQGGSKSDRLKDTSYLFLDGKAHDSSRFMGSDSSGMKNKPYCSMHDVTLNEHGPKDLEQSHASLPDLDLMQQQKQQHRFLLKSLQNVDMIVSASLQGFNHFLEESEKERNHCRQNVAEAKRIVNEKKNGEQNKSLLSKFLSSNVVKTNLDTLNDKVFIVFCISNFIACLSFYTPVIFLVDRAVHQGIDKNIGAVLISANGCGNILGRISTGWLADYCSTNRMLMFILGLGVQGIGTMLSCLCGSNAILHGIYAIFLGYFMGVYTILAPLVTVDLKGVSNIATAYGLVLTFKGTGSVIGPPVSGSLFDWTQSYALSYITNGVFQIASALILVPLLCRRYCRQKQFT